MSSFIAVDIETTGLYPVAGSKVYCIAVNTGKVIRVYQGAEIESLRPVLEDTAITKVIHNAAFDCFWLRMLHGIRVCNVWDTRLMEQVLLGENLPRSVRSEEDKAMLSSSLKYTLARYKLAELDKTIGANFATRSKTAPLTKAELEYAKDDVRYLLQLQAMQEYRLAKLDLTRVANLENRLVEVVVDMRARGIGFDSNRWIQIALQNSLTYNELLKRMPPDVANWNSPAQVKRYFNSKGIPVDSLTTIEELVNEYNDPVLKRFIEIRSLYKSTTTYGKGWLYNDQKGNTVDPDGRIRADFEQILNSGRFSCSNPNLQQIPRDGEHRSAFVPAKGNVFVIGDFVGQELGIMAAAAQEDIWLKAMFRREDIHSLTASLLYPEVWKNGGEKGCTFPKKCNCAEHTRVRHHAKTMNFAIAYGAGPQKIAAALKLSEKEASRLLSKYKRVVPNLTRWLETNARTAIKTRLSFSADPYRRRRTLRDPEEWMLKNVGKNNPVQSCGANMIKLAMISLSEATPVVLTLHDELVVEVPKAKAKKAAVELKAIMEKAAGYCTGLPGLIIVEPRIATSLAK